MVAVMKVVAEGCGIELVLVAEWLQSDWWQHGGRVVTEWWQIDIRVVAVVAEW